MDFLSKLVDWDALPSWREEVRNSGSKLVVTNGCFDLLHLGHVTYLETARNLGDLLLVGVNADDAVRELKGPNRPVNSAEDRAGVLAALESVSAVCIFSESTAVSFLAQAKPDVYVKGGDYTLETINQEERRVVVETGGQIRMLPLLGGRSTTNVLKRLGAA